MGQDDVADARRIHICRVQLPQDPVAAACVLACEVVQTLDVGTHMIFVGEVKDAEVLSDAAPMTYAYYHSTLKGKTPPKASSYVAEQ